MSALLPLVVEDGVSAIWDIVEVGDAVTVCAGLGVCVVSRKGGPPQDAVIRALNGTTSPGLGKRPSKSPGTEGPKGMYKGRSG